MKNKKILYIVLIVLFTALLLADVGIRAFTPTAMPSFSQRSDRQRPDFENVPEGQLPDFSGRRQRSTSPLAKIAQYWIPIAAVCALGDAMCIFLLVKTRKKEKQQAQAESQNSMPPLDDLDLDEPYRASHTGYWTAALCAALAVVLILTSVTPAAKESVSVNSKVLSGKSEVNTLSTVLSGTGTLTASEAEDVEIPAVVTVETFHVKNGDIVSEGDVLATVDSIAVRSAMQELQAVIDKLDYDLVLEKNKNPSSYINATASGRVKAIYAEVDRSVADTIYADGALMLLSLDGYMAVRIPLQLTIGTNVTVTLSDGSTEKGRVIAYSDGISTITISDKTAPCDDLVTVTDESGASLGSGKLFVHSPLKVVSYNGVVSRISVKLNQSVSNGATLLQLTEVGMTSKYTTLLSRRRELEEQMDALIQLSRDGKLRAKTTGIIQGIDEEIDYEPLASNTGFSGLISNGQNYFLMPLSYVVSSEPRLMLLGDGDEPSGDEPIFGTFEGWDENHFMILSGSDEHIDVSGLKIMFDPDDPDNEAGEELEAGDSVFITADCVYVAKNENPDSPTPSNPDKPGSNPDKPGNPDGGNRAIAGMVTKVGKNSITLQTMAGPVEVKNNGQKVTIDGKPGKFSDIAVGNTVSVTDKEIIVTTKSRDNSGMDPSALEEAMRKAMRGGMGGYGGNTTPQQEIYDTYDLTKSAAATITPLEEMTVSIMVDELDVLSLSEGMSADITLDAMAGKAFTGEITHINKYGTNEGGNTKYSVEVTLPRTPEMLEGMNASVKIVTSVSQPVSTIPAAALQEIGGKTYVYTAYDAKSDTLSGQVEVETGLSDGKLVEITSGLDENITFFYRYADSMNYSFT